MSTDGPPPIVPNMQPDAELPETEPPLARTDGGSSSETAPVDRPFGAPLVPDCS